MRNLLIAFNMAISMFTIIPLSKQLWEEKSGKYIMTLYPIVGLIVGVIWYSMWWILDQIGVSSMLMAAILVATPYVLTGFIHLDGFMDVADALLSRRDREVKLRILKDSTVGAFAVIALGLIFMLKFASIYTLVENRIGILGLIIIPIISRSLSGYFILKEEPLSESYFAKLFRDGSTRLHRYIIVIVVGIVLFISTFIGYNYLLMELIMIISGYLLVKNSIKELGGINGDVAGYTLILTEIIGLIVISFPKII